jgi:hypothetical protein
MTIVQEAKEWAEKNRPYDSRLLPPRHEELRIIEGLLLEIKCLKIQVRDRGNSFQKQVRENEKLRATLKEVSGCHSEHDTPRLCDGCLVSIADALEPVS